MDAVADYRAASETNDIAELMEALAPDAELVSPPSGHMVFRGHNGLRVLLAAVYGSLTDLRWQEEIGEGAVRVVTGDCRIAGLRLGNAMVLELGTDGRIKRIRAAPPALAAAQRLRTGARSQAADTRASSGALFARADPALLDVVQSNRPAVARARAFFLAPPHQLAVAPLQVLPRPRRELSTAPGRLD